jgi:hypothetical protein
VNFRRFDPAQLPELMGWFPDAEALRAWGGPEFRHPFTPDTFREDSRIDEIDSGSIVDADGGLGTRLLREMARWGLDEFGPRELSLFVRRDNEAAHRLYLRLGFREVPCPDPTSLADSRYMIAPNLPEAS